MKPFYKVTVDGKDITGTLKNRLIGLTITDNRGMESDQLTLEIDDADNAMALPRLGVEISVEMGFNPNNLVNKGFFIADEISHQGPADTISIHARAADLRQQIKTQKTRSFHQQTLGNIIKQLATDNQLQAVIHPDLSKISIDHIDQTTESDIHFATRLAVQYDALAIIKEGRLLFSPAGIAKTANDGDLPLVIIARDKGDSHQYQNNDRDKYTGIKANWYQTSTATEKNVLVGTAETVRTLQKRYPTESEAKDAAQAEFNNLNRGKATFSVTLAIGRPEIITESPVLLIGYKPEITNQQWVISKTTHNLNDSGLITQIECENITGEI